MEIRKVIVSVGVDSLDDSPERHSTHVVVLNLVFDNPAQTATVMLLPSEARSYANSMLNFAAHLDGGAPAPVVGEAEGVALSALRKERDDARQYLAEERDYRVKILENLLKCADGEDSSVNGVLACAVWNKIHDMRLNLEASVRREADASSRAQEQILRAQAAENELIRSHNYMAKTPDNLVCSFREHQSVKDYADCITGAMLDIRNRCDFLGRRDGESVMNFLLRLGTEREELGVFCGIPGCKIPGHRREADGYVLPTQEEWSKVHDAVQRPVAYVLGFPGPYGGQVTAFRQKSLSASVPLYSKPFHYDDVCKERDVACKAQDALLADMRSFVEMAMGAGPPAPLNPSGGDDAPRIAAYQAVADLCKRLADKSWELISVKKERDELTKVCNDIIGECANEQSIDLTDYKPLDAHRAVEELIEYANQQIADREESYQKVHDVLEEFRNKPIEKLQQERDNFETCWKEAEQRVVFRMKDIEQLQARLNAHEKFVQKCEAHVGRVGKDCVAMFLLDGLEALHDEVSTCGERVRAEANETQQQVAELQKELRQLRHALVVECGAQGKNLDNLTLLGLILTDLTASKQAAFKCCSRSAWGDGEHDGECPYKKVQDRCSEALARVAELEKQAAVVVSDKPVSEKAYRRALQTISTALGLDFDKQHYPVISIEEAIAELKSANVKLEKELKDRTSERDAANFCCDEAQKSDALHKAAYEAVQRELSAARDCGDGNVCGTVGDQCQKCLRAMFHREVGRAEAADLRLHETEARIRVLERSRNSWKADAFREAKNAQYHREQRKAAESRAAAAEIQRDEQTDAATTLRLRVTALGTQLAAVVERIAKFEAFWRAFAAVESQLRCPCDELFDVLIRAYDAARASLSPSAEPASTEKARGRALSSAVAETISWLRTVADCAGNKLEAGDAEEWARIARNVVKMIDEEAASDKQPPAPVSDDPDDWASRQLRNPRVRAAYEAEKAKEQSPAPTRDHNGAPILCPLGNGQDDGPQLRAAMQRTFDQKLREGSAPVSADPPPVDPVEKSACSTCEEPDKPAACRGCGGDEPKCTCDAIDRQHICSRCEHAQVDAADAPCAGCCHNHGMVCHFVEEKYSAESK